MGICEFLTNLFLPAGYPGSVAPEYARYQLWDTIQQVTFFVNTVISKQALMKFHGVGDPSWTAEQATALEMGRDLLASLISLLAATPARVRAYKRHVRSFRLASEVFNAFGHFLEIVAGMFSDVTALLYAGPTVCTIGGSIGGAVRAVILQHFGLGGHLPYGAQPDFGDISLKESNQDKGGKIVGLLIGVGILLGIGVSSSAPGAEEAALKKSVAFFAASSVIHIAGNIVAVTKLRIQAAPAEAAPAKVIPAKACPSACPLATMGTRTAFQGPMRRMFLPPGYPHTLAKEYTKFVLWNHVNTLVGSPKQVITSMVFWANVYGVGDSRRTPAEAVMIDILMTSVSCIAGLLLGLPAVSKRLDYTDKAWRFWSRLLGIVAESLQLAAALGPPSAFFSVIVVARVLAAFAGSSASKVDGAIPYGLISEESRRTKAVELVHVNVTSSNQSKLVGFPMRVLCISYLYQLDSAAARPSLGALIAAFVLLQMASLASAWGCYKNLPPLGEQKPEGGRAKPGPEAFAADSDPKKQALLGS